MEKKHSKFFNSYVDHDVFKLNFTLEQATKAQKGSRGIAVLL